MANNDLDLSSSVVSLLLERKQFDLIDLSRQMKRDWNLTFKKSTVQQDNTIIIECENEQIGIRWVEDKIPHQDLAQASERNYLWSGGSKVAKSHTNHIIIVLLHQVSLDKISAYRKALVLLVKVVASAAKQDAVKGIFALNTIFKPNMYRESARVYIRDDLFPIMNLVYFGVYSNDADNVSGFTYGMQGMLEKELEIINTKQTAIEIMDAMIAIAAYMINNNTTLRDGETIGLSEEEICRITESEGIALNGDTLKIEYQ